MRHPPALPQHIRAISQASLIAQPTTYQSHLSGLPGCPYLEVRITTTPGHEWPYPRPLYFMRTTRNWGHGPISSFTSTNKVSICMASTHNKHIGSQGWSPTVVVVQDQRQPLEVTCQRSQQTSPKAQLIIMRAYLLPMEGKWDHHITVDHNMLDWWLSGYHHWLHSQQHSHTAGPRPKWFIPHLKLNSQQTHKSLR